MIVSILGRPFKRVDPTKASPPATDGAPADQPSFHSMGRHLLPCVACNVLHPVGYCPLKLAGVEHCGLCGIAHIGYQRTCPHLNSEEQILSMLQSLKQSTEPKWLVDRARHYLYMVKGDLVNRRKKAEAAVNGLPGGSVKIPPPPFSSVPRPATTGYMPASQPGFPVSSSGSLSSIPPPFSSTPQPVYNGLPPPRQPPPQHFQPSQPPQPPQPQPPLP